MIENPFSLDGEVALITGGAPGIGLAIAHSFVVQGARVVIVGRRAEALEAACADLGPAATHRLYDVTDFNEAPALVDGDLLVGDIDGVVAIPQAIEAEVVERALDKVRDENMVAKKIREGMPSREVGIGMVLCEQA